MYFTSKTNKCETFYWLCFLFCKGNVTAGGRCYPGWTKTCSNTCLRYFNTKENFNGAKFACANLMGGKLVTLETKEKITYFKGFLVEQGKVGMYSQDYLTG